MGMKNGNTATGVGKGELSEAVFGFALLSRVFDVDMFRIIEMWDDNDVDINNWLFFGDGKTEEAIAELRAFASGNKAEATKEVIDATTKFVNEYNFPEFDHIANLGTKSKDDMTLFLDGERIQGFSLKWGHTNSYRQQSVNWKSIDALYGMFVDMDNARDAWESVKPTFTTPALRYSSARGDYSAELRAQTDKMQNDYDNIIWGEFMSQMSKADHKRVATAMLGMYTGTSDDITMVDLSTGKVMDISKDSVDALSSTIGDISFVRRDSKDGRTRRLIVNNNDSAMMVFEFTQSTNAARGGLSRDWRIAKPQVYVKVNI